MFNDSNLAVPYCAGTVLRRGDNGPPLLIAMSVDDAIHAIRQLEEECGLIYDEAGIFSKLMEFVKHENQAIGRMEDYVDYQTYRNGIDSVCWEQKEYLKCLAWLTWLMLHQLKALHLYRQGSLPYVLEALKGTRLTLRRRDSFETQVNDELRHS